MSQVYVIQKWNGTSKVPLHLLYSKFLAYLIDQVSGATKHGNDNQTYNTFLSENKSLHVVEKNSRLPKKNSSDWIETLPLTERRKYCIWRILPSYFINVKNLSFDDSYVRIHRWLDRCNELRELDFDPETKIKDSLNGVINTGYLPISLDNPLKEPKTLKTDNRELYNIITT